MLSRTGLMVAAASKVATEYRALVAAGDTPTINLLDGRVSAYAYTPLPAVRADSVVAYAAKSPAVSNLDLAFFLLIDGKGLAALDRVIEGKDVRPESEPYFEDILASVRAQGHDPSDVNARMTRLNP